MVEGMRFNADDAADKFDPIEPSSLDKIGHEDLPPELKDEEEKEEKEEEL